MALMEKSSTYLPSSHKPVIMAVESSQIGICISSSVLLRYLLSQLDKYLSLQESSAVSGRRTNASITPSTDFLPNPQCPATLIPQLKLLDRPGNKPARRVRKMKRSEEWRDICKKLNAESLVLYIQLMCTFLCLDSYCCLLMYPNQDEQIADLHRSVKSRSPVH